MDNNANKIIDMENIAKIALANIEIINLSITAPNEAMTLDKLKFNVTTEHLADIATKNIIEDVNIFVKDNSETFVLGSIKIRYTLNVENFDECIPIKGGQATIPQLLLETVNGLALSTTRGVMYMAFRGTFLHGAILPIIDTTQIVITQNANN